MGLIVKIAKFSVVTTSISIVGLLIGAMVVILPPMAPVGAVALAGVVLMWAAPELRRVPQRVLHAAFLAVVVVDLCVPAYYAVQFPGLPWISIRRLITMIMIVLLCFTIAGSASTRQRLSNILAKNTPLFICLIGFVAMAFISIFVSQIPTDSLSHFLEIVLNWYIPFFGCLVVLRSQRDIFNIFRIVGILVIVVSFIGVLEFITQHRLAIDVIPKSLLSSMMAANPSFADLVNSNPFRNGQYRASAVFNVPLSFGEFAAMVGPIGGYFLLHSEKWIGRILGLSVLASVLLALFVSGSRGGIIAFLIAMPTLFGLWVVRYSRLHRHSLAGPVAAVTALIGFVSVVAIIFIWQRAYNVVLGGGDAASSNDARLMQWQLAWPHILQNPVTGHGVGMAGFVIDYHSPGGLLTQDSYVMTLLVDMGVPGLFCFFGMIFFAVWACTHIYLTNFDRFGALGGPLACSFIAFGFYRFALSQQENQTLFFFLLALAFLLGELANGHPSSGVNSSKPYFRGPGYFRSKDNPLPKMDVS